MRAAGVVVCNVPGSDANSVAEHAFALMLAVARAEVVFTPHVAFSSVETVERINAMTVENIRAFLEGAPVNVVEGN